MHQPYDLARIETGSTDLNDNSPTYNSFASCLLAQPHDYGSDGVVGVSHPQNDDFNTGFRSDNRLNYILNGPHQLNSRTIDPKPCDPCSLQKPKRSNSFPKVFLGGIPSNITKSYLRTFFTRFGKVMDVVIMYDKGRKKSRGFGFLSFEDDEAVDRCVAEQFVDMYGKLVEIKRAEPHYACEKMDDRQQSRWAQSAGGPPMGMGGGMLTEGTDGQMIGPIGGSMGPKGHPGSMNQGYQGWGTPSQTQGYPGYSPPSASQGGSQGWGAPPGPEDQQMPPPQRGSTYGAPPQQKDYGGFGVMHDRSSAPGHTDSAPSGPGQSALGAALTQMSSAIYSACGPDNSYGQNLSSYGQQARSYGGDGLSQSRGGDASHPPVTGGQGDAPPSVSGPYPNAPGPIRGARYRSNRSQSFHPYRRMYGSREDN